MLFNPFTKVKIRVLVTVMVNLGKIMMDRQGRPKGHHDQEEEEQWYRYR